jgi:hypothetical protein
MPIDIMGTSDNSQLNNEAGFMQVPGLAIQNWGWKSALSQVYEKRNRYGRKKAFIKYRLFMT